MLYIKRELMLTYYKFTEFDKTPDENTKNYLKFKSYVNKNEYSHHHEK